MMPTSPGPDQTASWISDLRFAPFLAECGSDRDRALALYAWDGALAGACMQTIRHVEVLLRNAIHRTMRTGRADNVLRSWLVDTDLLDTEEIRRVEDAIALIKRHKHRPNEDRVVAAVTFGFWTSLLGTRYEQLWRQTLRAAFPNGDGTRHQVAGYTNRIAQFRNRLAHHEALFSQPIVDRYHDLLDLAGTIDPHARAWIEAQASVPAILAVRP
jgi:hypothetical protein